MTSENSSSAEFTRPWPVRALNALGRAAAPEKLVPIAAEPLIRRAERATGLSDWGSLNFRPALDRLIWSLNHESRLNLMGRLMLRDNLVRQLSNRLKIQRDITLHPEILETPVERPVFIVGSPRTGSTLLQRLLSKDPAVRSLQTWEMMLPSPPPEEASYTTDPRIALIERKLKVLKWSAPEFMVAHEVDAGEPEECVSLLQTTLMTQTYELMCNLPSYREWVDAQSPIESYSYYRVQLQLLQYRMRRNHWVLKSPFHLFGLPAILELFPDAIIIQTHRDPDRVIPSVCSLFNVMHQLTSDHADPLQLGPVLLQRLATMNDRYMDIRDQLGNERFHDISFRQLVQSPLEAVEAFQQRFGFEYTPMARSNMEQWLAANPQHKHGVHRYTLEQFGLEQAQVDRAFGRYRERYAEFLD